jgi:hypothetical protein
MKKKADTPSANERESFNPKKLLNPEGIFLISVFGGDWPD